MKNMKYLAPIFIAALFTIPGLCLRLFHLQASPPVTVLVTGTAIFCGSFLLLWACDAAQADISQTLALAVVALIAVLPEYAVDMYFTWMAGKFPNADYSHYAIANMTGANRLLIGVAWTMIAAIFWLKTRKAVRLEEERRTEILFLGLATAYAFLIPLKGSLEWYDGVVLVGLYFWYIRLAGRRPCLECELEGPAVLLVCLPTVKRRLVTGGMFLFSALVILANAEPFSEGLLATGKLFGINEFLLVQWLAPIASEAPEFIVALMFALRGQASTALGSLLSAKLNQWTLLVGMIPGVYALSSGSLAAPIPMVRFQLDEILLTAAQSLLAVILLAGMRLDLKRAALLFFLFIGQFIAPVLIAPLSQVFGPAVNVDRIHLVFSAAYVIAAIAMALADPRAVKELSRGFIVEKVERQPVKCTLYENAEASGQAPR